MSITAVIADSQPVVCAGLYAFFSDSSIQIVDEANTSARLLQKVQFYNPDLILFDPDLPDESGFETVVKIRQSGFQGKIVFWTHETQPSNLVRARQCGVDAWFLKKVSQTELIHSIQFVLDAKDRSFSGELRKVAEPIRPSNNGLVIPSILTPRERQVLRKIANGLSNKEIAFSLGLSRNTVKEYVQNVLRKLNVRDRTEAAIWAVKNEF